ncbi:hypothetical protein CRUP_015728 [Coryphaenoides rupestris]|nr:hypothetical protein CRUP_015728 [Coryphaenoides rupestris]
MEATSGSNFGIDTILSSASNTGPSPAAAAAAAMMMTTNERGDSRLGEEGTRTAAAAAVAAAADARSRATPSPACSDIVDTVGSEPSSPISVTMDTPDSSPQHHPLHPHHHHLHHHHHSNSNSLHHHLHHHHHNSHHHGNPLAGGGGGGGGGGAAAARTATSSFLIKDILGDSKPLAACAPYSTSTSVPSSSSSSFTSRGPRARARARRAPTGTKEEGEREISSSRDSPPSRSKKPRKARTAFSDHQLNQLERSFERQKTKWKRQTAVGLELLAEAGNYSALQRMFPSPYFYHPSLLGGMDGGTAAAAAAAAAMYSSMYRTPPPPSSVVAVGHPALQRPLVPRVLIHGLGPGGQPALNPLGGIMQGAPHAR